MLLIGSQDSYEGRCRAVRGRGDAGVGGSELDRAPPPARVRGSPLHEPRQVCRKRAGSSIRLGTRMSYGTFKCSYSSHCDFVAKAEYNLSHTQR